jgi:hypothetical protein
MWWDSIMRPPVYNLRSNDAYTYRDLYVFATYPITQIFTPHPTLHTLFPRRGKRSFASVFLCFNLSQSPHLSNLHPSNRFMWLWPDRQADRTLYLRCFWSKAAILLPSNICSKSESKFYSQLQHWWWDVLCCSAGFRLLAKGGRGFMDSRFVLWTFRDKKLRRITLNVLYCSPKVIRKINQNKKNEQGVSCDSWKAGVCVGFLVPLGRLGLSGRIIFKKS